MSISNTNSLIPADLKLIQLEYLSTEEVVNISNKLSKDSSEKAAQITPLFEKSIERRVNHFIDGWKAVASLGPEERYQVLREIFFKSDLSVLSEKDQNKIFSEVSATISELWQLYQERCIEKNISLCPSLIRGHQIHLFREMNYYGDYPSSKHAKDPCLKNLRIMAWKTYLQTKPFFYVNRDPSVDPLFLLSWSDHEMSCFGRGAHLAGVMAVRFDNKILSRSAMMNLRKIIPQVEFHKVTLNPDAIDVMIFVALSICELTLLIFYEGDMPLIVIGMFLGMMINGMMGLCIYFIRDSLTRYWENKKVVLNPDIYNT